MTIAEIKNPWLRRIVLAIYTPPAMLAIIVLGAIGGAAAEALDCVPLIRSAWRGRS